MKEKRSPTEAHDLAREVARIYAERIDSASRQVPRPRPVSKQVRPLYGKLVRTRNVFVVASAITLLWASAVIVAQIPFGFFTSALAIVMGIILLSSIFAEVLLGAGTEIETEYKTADEFERAFSFRPSISHVLTLLGIISLALVSVIIGFAAAYVSLSRTLPFAFSTQLEGLTSVYFSVVTFSTVGYGEIYPVSPFARLLTICQIVVSWLLVAIILGTLIPWAIMQNERRLGRRTAERVDEMQWREALMREAGLGVYGDSDEILAEARRRMGSQESSADSGKKA